MPNKSRGFFLLWRCIDENKLLNDGSPFDKMHAWIDLISLANYEDKEMLVGGVPIVIERGQHLTSERKLAERWHWSRSRVHRFLVTLERTKSITTKRTGSRTGHGTIISIVKYEDYNDMRTIKRTNSEASNRTNNVAQRNNRNKEKEKASPDSLPLLEDEPIGSMPDI